MNAGQYEGLIGRLDAILAKMPAVPQPDNNPSARGQISDRARLVGRRDALETVLEVLDGWIQGAKENHEAMEHRNERIGEECWHRFAPSDIRNMINDAAQELGLVEFPVPAHPQEDAS